jgi:hypothetical protein
MGDGFLVLARHIWASMPSIWRRPLRILAVSFEAMLSKESESSASMMAAGAGRGWWVGWWVGSEGVWGGRERGSVGAAQERRSRRQASGRVEWRCRGWIATMAQLRDVGGACG